MKIWISKNSEVSVREQIVTQISVGLASGDIRPGEKLPSTRELARRFGIHPNTVSSAYRELAAAGVLMVRRGSGIFASPAADGAEHLGNVDRWFAELIASAAAAGFSREQLRTAMTRWLKNTEPADVLLFEPDPGLRDILLEELSSCLGRPAAAVGFDGISAAARRRPCLLAALYDEKEKVLGRISPNQKVVFLNVNSVTASLANQVKPAKNELIAVVSGWEKFLAFARVYLLAAEIEPDRLMVRSTLDPAWGRGLSSASIIVCDALTATLLPDDGRLRVFRLIHEASLAELRNLLG